MTVGFAEAFGRFAPGDRVWIAGATGEPTAALDALAADPGIGRGLEFCGVWLPGINLRDPSAGVPEATARTAFVNAGLREALTAGRLRYHPLHYSAVPGWIGTLGLKGAILQVSPPEGGMVTPGLACDFADALLASGAALIGQVNPAMPAPPSAPRIPVERFAALIEAETPLPEFDGGTGGDELYIIAAQIAGMIEPRDTLIIGIGKAADAVLAALGDHRNLGYHAGMIPDAAMPLIEGGVFSRGVTAGVAIGTRALYDRAGRHDGIRWMPVSHTHDAGVLAAIPRLVTVTAAIEVDLLGQANGEALGGGRSRAMAGRRTSSAAPRPRRGGGRSWLCPPPPRAGGSAASVRCWRRARRFRSRGLMPGSWSPSMGPRISAGSTSTHGPRR
jgi:acyl-CoA hydrolase